MTSAGGDGGGTSDGGGAPPAGTRAMSIVRWALVGVMAAIAVASIAYATRGHGQGSGSGAATAAAHLWTCPMHPQVIRDQPGQCPICSMTLVPKDPTSGAASPSGASSGSASSSAPPGLAPITLTPERIQLAGMKTAPVTRAPLRAEVRASGVVAESERGLAQINTRFAGWIQKLLVSETGREVRRGDILATIYSPDVLRAQQEYLTARRWTGGGAPGAPAAPPDPGGAPALDLAEDARRRLELLGLAEPEIAELARSGQPVRDVAVRAPVGGTVIRRDAVLGSYVQPGASLFTVADLSTVWVLADVHEYDMRRLKVGQAARVELAAYPGQPFAGRVSFIYPTLDAQTRTVRARVDVKNARRLLRPGMYGTVVLAVPAAAATTTSAAAPLSVPSEAVVDTGDAQYVFIAGANGRFLPRPVKVGARAEGRAEILEGLAEGESVVTTANFLIDSESRLRAAIEGQGGK